MSQGHWKLVLVVLAVAVAAALWHFQNPLFGTERTIAEPKRHPASHVIRVTAKLTFDGKPVEFDELIDCKTTYRGTPTSSPHMTFTLDRRQIATETPDGGAIVIRVSRSFCFVYGDTWGDVFDEFTPPEGWTPVIEWYDRRDPRQAETGIIYLSETALEAGKGRLRIIEPFRIAIPEYPASPALIAEAARQAEQHKEEQELRFSYGYRAHGVEWMLRIPESAWRNPERAVLSFKVGRQKSAPQPDFSTLAAVLDSVEGERGVVNLGYPDDLGSKDVSKILYGLLDGQDPSLVGIYEQGIPKRKMPRHGILISEKTAKRNQKNPFFPDRFDDYVPFTCIGGVMTPMPETPGLIYWFRDDCVLPDHHKGVNFLGKPFAGEFMPPNGRLIFDLETRDLWWLDSN
jgi:hypothetical protein